jgi:hypothetical protein
MGGRPATIVVRIGCGMKDVINLFDRSLQVVPPTLPRKPIPIKSAFTGR